ncbi:hypothetical protein BHE90_000398 [Fusarium euwallaceae]|uniref:Uncharacterized protein n=1 Tax=Fusarium euwallaceae TaxID=1147111 RepID=A0A430MAR9_9HYPO|nr:hypothetical protein BHE90_000398 [Fusarium euwallaceae]
MRRKKANPGRPYKDPTAAPIAGISPESLALSGASDAGDVSRVRAILSSLPDGAVLSAPPAEFLSRARFRSAVNDLKDASKVGDVERVREVVHAWRADPSLENPITKDMDMPMISAAQNAKSEVVRFFLDEGVPVSPTAIKLAATEKDGAVGVFQAFLDHGWDINSSDRIPALHLATKSIPLTKWFLKNGADPNLISKDGYTPLDFAAIHPTPDVPVIVDLLLSSGAIPAHSNALHNALISTYHDRNCTVMMMMLLRKGFDVNALSFTNRPKFRGRNPSTPLHWAVRKHHARKGRKNMLARVRWLIDHGADVEVRDSKGKTPIEWASDEALIEVLRGKKASSAPCGNGARRQTVKTWLRRH